MNNQIKIISVAVIAFLLLGSIIALNISPKSQTPEINSFEECVFAGYPVLETYPEQCKTPDGKTFVRIISLEDYFFQEMVKIGNENLGAMPIEGYDPDLYMGAFNGLKKEDFHEVEAIGGIWKLKNNELVFERTGPQGQITSADGTINEKGMKTLLNKLSERLNIKVSSQEDVDKVIDSIDV
ncbi:MAG: hypothetical protein Q7S27_05635 [Nanoarchaeota archaeon]|nr:hypothetical protein [Nanoarchaeota archaeon]